MIGLAIAVLGAPAASDTLTVDRGEDCCGAVGGTGARAAGSLTVGFGAIGGTGAELEESALSAAGVVMNRPFCGRS